MTLRQALRAKAVLQKAWELSRQILFLGGSRESSRAFLLAANLFLLLAAYYILKTVREALILTEGGAEIKSYSAAGQSLLLLVIVPAYGALASKVQGARLVRGVTLFSILHLLAFSLLGASGVPVGRIFFLWVGTFVLVIAQSWALAGDVFPAGQGKRLLSVVGLGSAAGAGAGAWLASNWFTALGPYHLMLVAAGMLFGSVLLTGRAGRIRSAADQVAEQPPAAGEPGRPGSLPRSPWRRCLLWIALLTLLMNMVNSTGEYILGKMVMAEAARVAGSGMEGEILKQAFVGQFYARFFGWANLLGIVLQLLFVPLILRQMCLPAALFILPTVALAGYGVLAAAPVLALVRIAKMLENGTDYSIQNTARHALFLPASREIRYQAQTIIEAVFSRAGDLLHALVIFLGTRLSFGVATYASVNLVLTLAALLVVVVLCRENRKVSVWS